MSSVRMQSPRFVEGEELKRLEEKANFLAKYEATVLGKPGEAQVLIPLTKVNGDIFVLSAVTEDAVDVTFKNKDPGYMGLNRIKFFIDNQYSYSLLSKGIDKIQIYEVDSNDDGINEILVRYSFHGHMLEGAHLLVMS